VVAQEGRFLRVNDAATVIYRQKEGVDTCDLEHGDEQGGLVFAIAVTVAEDIRSSIGLEATDAPLNDEVAVFF
jgi:hypothetical protein